MLWALEPTKIEDRPRPVRGPIGPLEEQSWVWARAHKDRTWPYFKLQCRVIVPQNVHHRAGVEAWMFPAMPLAFLVWLSNLHLQDLYGWRVVALGLPFAVFGRRRVTYLGFLESSVAAACSSLLRRYSSHPYLEPQLWFAALSHGGETLETKMQKGEETNDPRCFLLPAGLTKKIGRAHV